jgi:TonB family protein
MRTVSGLLLVLALLAPSVAPAQTKAAAEAPMFEASGLAGWSAQHGTAGCVNNVSGTVALSECAGWLRTDTTVFTDYAMAFEVRERRPGARALFGTLGISDRTGRPELVIALPILGISTPPRVPRQIHVLPLSLSGWMQAMNPEPEWQSYRVTRNRQGIHVLLNGTQVLSSGPVRASDGWLGFLAEGETIELRNVTLRHLFPLTVMEAPAPGTVTASGAYRPGKGVSLPRLRHEEKPKYTGAAIGAKLEGTVMVECVVETDGTVGSVKVLRSLDDRYGLDDEAIYAARRWRFEPGTREGVPVPVVITIELKFSLKK